MMMRSNVSLIHHFGHYLAYLIQYSTLYRSLVSHELKGRFKYTALGYFWHLLNPLFQITVYFVIFTVIFGRDIENYWIYVSTGMFAYSMASSLIVTGTNVIVSNKRMVTKMAFPREILIFSKATVSVITLTISYSLLLMMMIFTGLSLSLNLLWVPLIVLMMAFFAMGITLITSALNVYVRDIHNAVSIIMGCMMFSVPVFYLSSLMTNTIVEFIWHINPLFYYIESIHNVMYWGISPDPNYLAIGLCCSVVVFVVGLFIFKKMERGFAERL